MRVGVALGSNLGDRAAYLRAARTAVLALPGVAAGDCRSAPFYETNPINCPPGSGAFLNSVLEVEYTQSPEALLSALLGVEAAAGRNRDQIAAAPNQPRPLDLDLLYAGEIVCRSPILTLPHPRMLVRRFVLAPLAAIRPDLVLPGQVLTIAAILTSLDDDPSQVALSGEQW